MVSPDQAMMIQALMGGVAQPGVMQSGQNPVSKYGTSFLTGNPTVPGGMLGNSPYQSVNPNSMQSMAPNQQMMQPMAQFPSQAQAQMPQFGGGGMGGGN